MANSTLLSLFQTSLQGMGVSTYGNPTTVIGNTNQDVTQVLALVNAAGDELAREHYWQAGTVEYRFTTVFYQYTGNTTNGSASLTGMSSIVGLPSDSTFQVTGSGINQDTYVTAAAGSTVTISQAATATATGVTLTFSQTKYAFPTDYDRLMDRTDWDKSKHWEMLGPETAQQWQWLKSGYIATGPRIRFRPLGNYFQVWPAVSTNEYLGLEYQSKYWIYATGGSSVSKQSFSADTDTTLFPDPLMRALIKLKYFEIKNFDTTALYRDFMKQLDLAKAHDAGSPTLSFAPRPGTILITHDNVPDSGYGQAT